MTYVEEFLHNGTNDVVDSEGNVRSAADFTDAVGDPIDIPDTRIVEQIPSVEAASVYLIDLPEIGPIERKMEDVMDNIGNYRTTSEDDALRRINRTREDLNAERAANREKWLKAKSDAVKLASGGITKASRSRRSK